MEDILYKVALSSFGVAGMLTCHKEFGGIALILNSILLAILWLEK